jgi:hypothetical protein
MPTLPVGILGGIPPSYYFDALTKFGGGDVGKGFGLPVVYGIWLAVSLLLYPVSCWFAGVKRRRRDWWLTYV